MNIIKYPKLKMKNYKQKNKSRRLLPVLVGALVLVGAGAFYLFYINPNGKEPKKLDDATTIGSNTKGVPSNSEAPASSDKTKTDKQDQETGSPDISIDQESLDKPYGNFVSSHNVSTNSLIASNCITTPGASCTITFTKDGVTKSLSKQTTDHEGATYWEWRPDQLGLTPGEWTIEAVATSGTASKSTKDVIKLGVNDA